MTENETLSNVEKALNEIRPFLMSDGGNIKLLSIEGVVVKVQLEGACTGCSVNQMTLKNGVEATIKKYAPQIEAYLRNLLDNKKNYGIGFSKAITYEGLYHFKRNDKVEKPEIYSNGKIGLSKDSLKAISNKLMGLSWHYIMKGNAIK